MAPKGERPRTIVLTLAYEGTNFLGWQRQKNARTVQAVLEDALQQILGKPVKVTGAGRTDSGVHAEAQVAHAAIRSAMPLKTLHRALNAVLPEDLLVLSLKTAPSNFHARYSATRKRYRYVIWNRPHRPLFDRTRLTYVSTPLDLKKMRQAARLLRGRHDFKAFHSAGRPARSTRRTLSSLTLRAQNGMLVIEAEADGFLYHMVRRIAGLLLEVGKGQWEPEVVRDLLAGKNSVIPPTAPAKGLCLAKIWYVKIKRR